MTQTVGILGYQGCIEPHEEKLLRLGVRPLRVRTSDELAAVDRLILPGGESTTMLRFIKRYGMLEPLKLFAASKPVWGICAGAILAAREVHNPEQDSLGIMDIAAHRNFYGSQLDSFTTTLDVQGLGGPIEAQFIRAPLLSPLEPTQGRPVPSVESSLPGQPVFISQGHLWACSFHVELVESLALHERFVRLMGTAQPQQTASL